MGFCRRCGDIIGTEKCRKCGGTAVAGVVKIADVTNTPRRPDRWERKYTHRRSISPSNALSPLDPKGPDVSISLSPMLRGGERYPIAPSPERRKARPLSSEIERFGAIATSHKINTETMNIKEDLLENIENKQVKPVEAAISREPPADQPSADTDPTLTKVHGTLLSPPPPIPCHYCHTPFAPTSTLYPLSSSSALLASTGTDLQLDSSALYACGPCFTQHRSLGPCASCSRPVLPLRAQGKYVQLTHEGDKRVWHARCFVCVGCGKDLSSRPMVGLGGEPECEGCFGKGVRASPRKGEERKERAKDVVREMQGAFGSPVRREDTATPAPPSPSPVSVPAPVTPSRPCPTCALPLAPPGQTVPLIHAADATYHAACFVCAVCRRGFVGEEREEDEGTAVYALWEGRAVHVQCAPGVATTPKASPAPAPKAQQADSSPPKRRYLPHTAAPATTSPLKPRPAPLTFPSPPSSPTRAAPSARPSSTTTRPTSPLKSPIFNPLRCPACLLTVSPLEKGVVKGPDGAKWHGRCLVCGGGRGDGDVEVGSGCGKRLDSGAKEAAGRIWCRGCWDALPATIRPASPTRATPLAPMHTGLSRSPSKASAGLSHSIFPRAHQRADSLVPQMTGSGLPITRQLTGTTYVPTGGLARQVTGGSFGASPGGPVAQLVRQMTGNGQSSPGRRPRSLYAPSMLSKLENVVED